MEKRNSEVIKGWPQQLVKRYLLFIMKQNVYCNEFQQKIRKDQITRMTQYVLKKAGYNRDKMNKFHKSKMKKYKSLQNIIDSLKDKYFKNEQQIQKGLKDFQQWTNLKQIIDDNQYDDKFELSGIFIDKFQTQFQKIELLNNQKVQIEQLKNNSRQQQQYQQRISQKIQRKIQSINPIITFIEKVNKINRPNKKQQKKQYIEQYQDSSQQIQEDNQFIYYRFGECSEEIKKVGDDSQLQCCESVVQIQLPNIVISNNQRILKNYRKLIQKQKISQCNKRESNIYQDEEKQIKTLYFPNQQSILKERKQQKQRYTLSKLKYTDNNSQNTENNLQKLIAKRENISQNLIKILIPLTLNIKFQSEERQSQLDENKQIKQLNKLSQSTRNDDPIEIENNILLEKEKLNQKNNKIKTQSSIMAHNFSLILQNYSKPQENNIICQQKNTQKQPEKQPEKYCFDTNPLQFKTQNFQENKNEEKYRKLIPKIQKREIKRENNKFKIENNKFKQDQKIDVFWNLEQKIKFLAFLKYHENQKQLDYSKMTCFITNKTPMHCQYEVNNFKMKYKTTSKFQVDKKIQNLTANELQIYQKSIMLISQLDRNWKSRRFLYFQNQQTEFTVFSPEIYLKLPRKQITDLSKSVIQINKIKKYIHIKYFYPKTKNFQGPQIQNEQDQVRVKGQGQAQNHNQKHSQSQVIKSQKNTRQKWTKQQNLRYLVFVINNKHILNDPDRWKKSGIYIKMSKWVKSRSNEMCRHRHRTLLKKHKTLQEIKINLQKNIDQNQFNKYLEQYSKQIKKFEFKNTNFILNIHNNLQQNDFEIQQINISQNKKQENKKSVKVQVKNNSMVKEQNIILHFNFLIQLQK